MANAMVIQNHYLHRKAPAIYSFGLFDGMEMIGCIIYGKPASRTLCIGVCGPEESSKVIELTRLWIEDGTPKTDFAAKCDRMNIKLNNLYKKWDCIYYIENPRAMLRKMDFMKGMDRTTVTYCSYGDTRMKPTDIFSNNIRDMFNLNGWQPRNMCFNGNKKCQHEAAPRGSRTGTQGLKGNYERSKVPYELVLDIITQTENKYD